MINNLSLCKGLFCLVAFPLNEGKMHLAPGLLVACYQKIDIARESESKAMIVMEKNTLEKHKSSFTCCLRSDWKKRLMNCSVWSVLMYASETWTKT